MAIRKINSRAIADGAVATADLDDNPLTIDSLTVDTNTLVVDAANNRVGIGSTSPQKKFVVSNAGAAGLEIDPTNRSSGVGTSLLSYNRSGSAYVRADYDAAEHLMMVNGSERARFTANGLTFNGDTAAANALDDYEEGLWNPTFVSSNGGESVTYDIQKGGYVKVGRLVHIQIQLGTTSVSGGSGYIQIGNLPFANDGGTNGASAIPIDLAYGFASTITGGSSAQVGDSVLHFYKNDNSANVWNWTTLATGTGSNRLWMSGTYITS